MSVKYITPISQGSQRSCKIMKLCIIYWDREIRARYDFSMKISLNQNENSTIVKTNLQTVKSDDPI